MKESEITREVVYDDETDCIVVGWNRFNPATGRLEFIPRARSEWEPEVEQEKEERRQLEVKSKAKKEAGIPVKTISQLCWTEIRGQRTEPKQLLGRSRVACEPRQFEIVEVNDDEVISHGYLVDYWDAVQAARDMAEDKAVLTMVLIYCDDLPPDVVWDSFVQKHLGLATIKSEVD